MTENFLVRAIAILIVGAAAAAFYWGGGRLQGYPVSFTGVRGIAITTAFFLGLLGTRVSMEHGTDPTGTIAGFYPTYFHAKQGDVRNEAGMD